VNSSQHYSFHHSLYSITEPKPRTTRTYRLINSWNWMIH